MPPAIHAEGLGKAYTIGHALPRERYLSLRGAIAQRAATALRNMRDFARGRALVEGDQLETVWALRDVGFEVAPGEVIGVIGRNGAGKSTLLKILSRITDPSAGRVTLRGRVASLLEVGTGFHPELSGRENIFLNGAILGMRRDEVRAKFDEIVAFAEVERYLDTPVKRYSSGMYVRLAFAVAAHLDPEILLVDEVLAVGDAQFQKKCLGKIGAKGREGRTVILVSHQMASISGLCSRALLLDRGRLVNDGPAPAVIESYMRANEDADAIGVPRRIEHRRNDDIRLHSVMVSAAGDAQRAYLDTGDDLQLTVDFESLKPGRNVDVTFDLYNEQGIHVCHFGRCCAEDGKLPAGAHRCVAVFPGSILNAGHYTLHVMFGLDQKHVLLRHENAAGFTLEDAIGNRGANFARLPGVIHPPTRWTTRPLQDERSARCS
jgi:lipopolysaccharide transport system ATP-binding protein